MVFSMYRTTDRFPPLSLSFSFSLMFFLQKLLIEDRLDVYNRIWQYFSFFFSFFSFGFLWIRDLSPLLFYIITNFHTNDIYNRQNGSC